MSKSNSLCLPNKSQPRSANHEAEAATPQRDSIIFHSLTLIRTLSLRLLAFILIHFAISASASDSIQSSVPASRTGCVDGPRGLDCGWLSGTAVLPCALPSAVRSGAEGEGKGSSSPTASQELACLLSGGHYAAQLLDLGFGMRKWEP